MIYRGPGFVPSYDLVSLLSPHPLPPVSKLCRQATQRKTEKERQLADGEECEGVGAKRMDR